MGWGGGSCCWDRCFCQISAEKKQLFRNHIKKDLEGLRRRPRPGSRTGSAGFRAVPALCGQCTGLPRRSQGEADSTVKVQPEKTPEHALRGDGTWRQAPALRRTGTLGQRFHDARSARRGSQRSPGFPGQRHAGPRVQDDRPPRVMGGSWDDGRCSVPVPAAPDRAVPSAGSPAPPS